MANEKFKLIFDDDGKTVTKTENHPKVDAPYADKTAAMQAIGALYQIDPVRIDLQSDTTVWSAE